MSTTLGKLREYETVIVVNPDLTDDVVNETIVDRLKGVLEKMKAELLREDRWGKRKMAFETNRNARGNYILMHFVGERRRGRRARAPDAQPGAGHPVHHVDARRGGRRRG